MPRHRIILSPSPDGPLLAHGKADLIPVEILSEIFLIVVRDWGWSPAHLALVCRRWYAIMLSTPAILSQLRIRRPTQKEVVQPFIRERTTHLRVTVAIDDENDGNVFNTENFHACFMAASQAASRWRSLKLRSPPPHGECKDLQILQPLVRLETLKLGRGFGKLVEPLMTAIGKTASPELTTMDLADPVAVLYLVQPACLRITHSIT